MNLSGLLPLIEDTANYRRFLDGLQQLATAEQGSSSLTLSLLNAARPSFIAALQRHWPGHILLVTPSPEQARQAYEQVRIWSARPDRVRYFPAPDALFYDRTPWDGETIHQRISVLAWLTSTGWKEEGSVIVTSAWAFMTCTIPPEYVRQGIMTLHRGQKANINDLIRNWLDHGYQLVPVVEEAGTFSHRGGIVDIYPPHREDPVRIEFSGNEIESLRSFDPVSQRSKQFMESVEIIPASEALPRYAANARAFLDHLAARPDSLSEGRLHRDLPLLETGVYFRGMEFYLACLAPQPCTLSDYLPPSTLFVFDDRRESESAAKRLEAQAVALRAELEESGELPPDFPVPYIEWPELASLLTGRPALHLGIDEDTEEAIEPGVWGLSEHFGGRLNAVIEKCAVRKSAGDRVIMVSRQASRLADLLRERDLYVTPTEDVATPPPPGSLTLVQGSLAEGWTLHLPESRSSCIVWTDKEIFGWARRRSLLQRKRPAAPEAFFAELHEGDYVVHIEHGIAIYRGLVRKVVDGTEREYLDLEYDAGDRLYVPVSQIDRVSRYIGLGQRMPTLHRLGSADWARVRARAKKAVAEIASELLELYAAREVVQGFAFSPDTPWQAELEASFPYEETEDQLRALAEVKADMEKPKPMDRLICGDVGYGKTEVALRAAFKAAMDGKQVAMLVPTTVLAQQHLITFRERLAPFPITVEMLSRFCSPVEQRRVLDGLRKGGVDIVIGTHRLLQKDVEFKDLGLVIVDEEQRFGVAHKEWLKQVRRQVDVLTLTATPIPRTLHMALTGIRDMSTIDTPPEQRLPIRTQVAPYEEGLVRKAILRELERGGQVYFVHNRVMGIHLMAQRLQRIVPEARIAIAHGQMDEEALSKVMLDFTAGKYDVLVCTSIIESGLDIPNVNTIIINRADTFGLAQLYQLRGRVGRSSSQAYAYFLYSPRESLSAISRSRLQAILEASELGAGFRIAMRDLEIRGAGEILGTEQHGHIAAVGFDLYTRLLAQAVRELRAQREGRTIMSGDMPDVPVLPTVELPLEARLPEEYIPDENLRLRVYHRLAGLTTLSAIDEAASEIADRFGDPPQSVDNLFYVLRIRLLAAQARIHSIGRDNNHLALRLNRPVESWESKVIESFGQCVWMGQRQIWVAIDKDATWRGVLLQLLKALSRSPGSNTV